MASTSGNIGTPKDVNRNTNSAAVGLYRADFFMYGFSGLRQKDEQYEAYKAVLEGMNGKPVVVRTMDINWKGTLSICHRHSRFPCFAYLYLKLAMLFRTQIALSCVCSTHHVPNGSPSNRIPAKLKRFMTKRKLAQEAEGVAVADNIQVGIMIEIPAAMLVDQLPRK